MQSTGNVIEVNAYYPYGKIIQGLSTSSTYGKNNYKYNGKELQTDMELGWLDYGVRMLDGPRWFVPDAYAEKYYHLSPYQYAANNPINFIDVNGDSVWYTTQDNIITMHVRGKVINSSSKNINMSRAASDIAFGISSVFGGKFESEGQNYILQTDVQLEAVASMEDVTSSDHLFNIVDAGGKVINIASVDYANDNWFSNNLSMNYVRSAVHEFGHVLGLTHESASRFGNIMTQTGSGEILTSEQMDIMMRAAPYINKGTNSYMGRPYPYLHGVNRKTGIMETESVHKVFNPSLYYKL